MRFIENAELREWVKDNLKKTIFQKAHALALQTGCEIFVKMKDITDPTSHLHYATGSLRKFYNNNALRRVPGERTVSGETGLPLVDQCVQFGDEAGVGFKDSYPEGEGSDNAQTGNESAIPMQLTVVTPETTLNQTADQSSCTESQDLNSDIKIKVEAIDDDEVTDIGAQSEQGVMTESGDQMTYSMEGMSENVDTSEMTTFQAIPTGLSMVGRASNSQKYSVPISPKPYQCGVCHKAFRSVQVLQKHTQTFHMRPSGSPRGRGSRGRGIHQFSKSFVYRHQTQQALVSRQAELESQNFTCVICDQTFNRPELLSEHITNSHSDDSTSSLSASLPALAGQFADPSSIVTSVAVSTGQMSPLQFPHSAPSGLDLPSGSVTFSQQGSQMQTPFKYRHPDAGMSNRPGTSSGFSGTPGSASKATASHPHRKSVFGKHLQANINSIMTAILLTAGPVASPVTVRRNGPRSLRSISLSQYDMAEQALQRISLGAPHCIKAPKKTRVFVKRPPDEVEDILKNSDFCTPEQYNMRYNMPSPVRITQNMQEILVQIGLVPREHFKRWDITPSREANEQNYPKAEEEY